MMKMLTRMIAGAAAITLLGDASMALAQAKPAAPAARPPASATPVAKPAAAPAAATATAPPPMVLTATTPGLCILSREGIVGASKVGKYVQTRLNQLQTQTQAELTGEQSSIQTADKDLEAKKTTLGTAYQQQLQALQQRATALQDKAQQRERELQATEQKALSRILLEATPFVEAEAKAKNCAVVLDATAVMAVNNSMNLTPAVVAALDGKLQQFDFDREHLDAQPATQQR
jgi:Skp family chaperone for outer membrane proteins